MAEQNETEAPAKKGKLPLKTLLVLAVILLLEVALAIAMISMARPAPVKAEGAAEDMAALAERPVEELVVADKFANTRQGKTFIYDTEVYIVVRQKNQNQTREMIETMSARISTDIGMIVSMAEPSHLLEPTRATLTRQIKAVLNQRLGKDAQGEPIVEQVLVRKLTQFRADP